MRQLLSSASALALGTVLSVTASGLPAKLAVTGIALSTPTIVSSAIALSASAQEPPDEGEDDLDEDDDDEDDFDGDDPDDDFDGDIEDGDADDVDDFDADDGEDEDGDDFDAEDGDSEGDDDDDPEEVEDGEEEEEDEGEDSDDDDDDDDRDDDDDDDDEDDDDIEDRGADAFEEAAGLEPDDYDFDEQGYPARSNEILAFDLDADDLAIARDLGFELIERRELANLSGSIDRLRVPPTLSFPDAVNALDGALPAAPFDYNHIYILPDDLAGGPDKEAGPVAPLGTPGSGEGVRIGVIDTLPDPEHPALQRQSLNLKDFAPPGGRDSVHATAVVSILAGVDPAEGYSGLAPGADVFAANIFSVGTDGLPVTDAFIMLEALDWLAGHDVGVINMSIAGPESAVVAEAIRRLEARGQIVVAAVGNDGPAAPPLFPAAHESTIGVTAIDLRGTVYRRAGRGDHVDLSAPGVRVIAAQPDGYGPVTGTSFATPVVAALMALSVPERTDNATEVVSRFVRSARDLGETGRDEVYGYGMVTTMPGVSQ